MSDQLLLNCIKNAFQTTLQTDSFNVNLSYIRKLFAVRDFKEIFTNEELLPVYCAEYLPGRALCYKLIFHSILHRFQQQISILALGAGNGAEYLGLAAAIADSNTSIELVMHDLSKYPLLNLFQSIDSFYNPKITVSQVTSDLLLPEGLKEIKPFVKTHQLITCMFLLNEILATSKNAFMAICQLLVREMPSGSYLLVVDSAGSFSQVQLGKNVYMSWDLMDRIAAFEIVEKRDSEWYRYPNGLEYPLKLKNMRYFLRLYRKK